MAHNTTGWFFFQAQLNSPFLFQSFSHYKIHNVNQFDSCSFFSFNYWFFVDLFTIHNIAFRFFINFSRVFIALIHFSSDCFQRYRKQKSSFGRIPSYFFFLFFAYAYFPSALVHHLRGSSPRRGSFTPNSYHGYSKKRVVSARAYKIHFQLILPPSLFLNLKRLRNFHTRSSCNLGHSDETLKTQHRIEQFKIQGSGIRDTAIYTTRTYHLPEEKSSFYQTHCSRNRMEFCHSKIRRGHRTVLAPIRRILPANDDTTLHQTVQKDDRR